MGNCLAHCRPNISSCMGGLGANNEKVLQVVKMDGKILEFSRPILVKDILVNFSGSGIGLSKEAQEHLPPSYELTLGKVYYILPSILNSAPVISPILADREEEGSGVKRIKVVLTKHQLQQLLTKTISVEEILLGIQKTSCSLDSPTNWKPELESIPEGCES